MDCWVVYGMIRDDQGGIEEFWIELVSDSEAEVDGYAARLNAAYAGFDEQLAFYGTSGPHRLNGESF